MAAPEPPIVFGCLADLRRRRRIDAALSGAADVTWFQSFNSLHEALGDGHRRPCVVVIDVEDPTGASAASFAQVLREFFPGIGVVAYGQAHQRGYADLCGLGAAGVHDVLLPGQSDEGFTARSIILGACRHGAADLVMEALERVLPLRLLPFAAAVVRNPSKGTIGKITKHLNV